MPSGYPSIMLSDISLLNYKNVTDTRLPQVTGYCRN